MNDYMNPNQGQINIIIPTVAKDDDNFDECERLRGALQYERLLRQELENKILDLQMEIEKLKVSNPRKRRTKEEMLEENIARAERMRTGIKKDGKPIAHAGNALRSYDDFKAVESALLDDAECGTRNAMLFVLGISMGVRASDLLQLKWRDIFEKDWTYRDRIYIVEQKTGKMNSSCIITEVMKQVIDRYVSEDERHELRLTDYVFGSNKKLINEPISVDMTRKIINGAAKKAGLDYNIGSHGMRKTFACIVATIDETTIPADAITKVQAHLNHNDQTTTMRYIGALQQAMDNEKQTVSDFLLGKTNKKEIAFDFHEKTDNELMRKLDRVIELLEADK